MIKNLVSAELGSHSSLKGNSKALSTVTIAADGIGSIDAAVTPLLAGLVANSKWNNVFNMLICADIVAMLLLLRLFGKEMTRIRRRNSRID